MRKFWMVMSKDCGGPGIELPVASYVESSIEFWRTRPLRIMAAWIFVTKEAAQKQCEKWKDLFAVDDSAIYVKGFSLLQFYEYFEDKTRPFCFGDSRWDYQIGDGFVNEPFHFPNHHSEAYEGRFPILRLLGAILESDSLRHERAFVAKGGRENYDKLVASET